jgi:hypothetical protein
MGDLGEAAREPEKPAALRGIMANHLRGSAVAFLEAAVAWLVDG